jgi:PhnB protein
VRQSSNLFAPEPSNGVNAVSRPAVKPIPEDYHCLTPYLYVHDASAALEFYRAAFDAVEEFRITHPDGPIVHAEMTIGDSPFMLSDEIEAWGNRSPRTIGGTGSLILVYVEDVDRVFDRAVEGGATAIMPVKDHFYGDRAGIVEDPFGHRWMIATRVERVLPHEAARRAEAMFGGRG